MPAFDQGEGEGWQHIDSLQDYDGFGLLSIISILFASPPPIRPGRWLYLLR
jgi:hypothetical protein